MNLSRTQNETHKSEWKPDTCHRLPMLVRFLWRHSVEPSSAMDWSRSRMLWFRLRIFATITCGSTGAVHRRGNVSTSSSFLSLDSTSLARLIPGAESMIFTLSFNTVRSFTSASRVWVRLAIWPCCLSFMRTFGNNRFARYQGQELGGLGIGLLHRLRDQDVLGSRLYTRSKASAAAPSTPP